MTLRTHRRRRARLRMCPLCASPAVSESYEQPDGLEGRYFLRCGQCDTWRGIDVTFWAARRLEYRLRHDRRRIARTLRQLEAAATGDPRPLAHR